jgi:hypothetical protein
MDRYAVISSNTHPDYAPFLPLTALFWRSVGYQTICLLTSDFAGQGGEGRACNPRACDPRVRDPHEPEGVTGYIVDCLRRQSGVVIHEVGDVEGFKTSTLAQVSRLAAAAVPVEDDAYLLTGDVDMLPFFPVWFNQQDHRAAFHVFCADVYGSPANKHYQMCYLGGTRRAWKSLMGMGDGSLDAELLKLLRGRSDGWFVDEAILAEKMGAWPSWEECQLISRGYPPGGYAPRRLDRGCWQLPGDLSTLIDCHSARPLEANWPVIGRLADQFLPADLRKLAHDYVNDLVVARQGLGGPQARPQGRRGPQSRPQGLGGPQSRPQGRRPQRGCSS